MSKMKKRRRYAKKQKNKRKDVNKPSFRIPTPPPSFVFKSKKDYKRQDNKKIINKGLDDA